jgi:hypothetical protein
MQLRVETERTGTGLLTRWSRRATERNCLSYNVVQKPIMI